LSSSSFSKLVVSPSSKQAHWVGSSSEETSASDEEGVAVVTVVVIAERPSLLQRRCGLLHFFLNDILRLFSSKAIGVAE
jgi:hypothetical protein